MAGGTGHLGSAKSPYSLFAAFLARSRCRTPVRSGAVNNLGWLVGLLGQQGLQVEGAAAAEEADVDMLVALARPPPPGER